MKKRGAFLWFAGGVLFAVTLGRVLLGAAGALLWTMQANVSDGTADDTLAARAIVAGADEGWGVPEFDQPHARLLQTWYRPDIGDKRECEAQLRRGFGVNVARHDVIVPNLYGAMVHEEQRMDRLDTYAAAENSLRRLPRLVLGAWAGCVKHSVLAGACGLAARSWLARDETFTKERDAAMLKNALRSDEQTCFLLDAAKSFSAKSKINSPPSTEQRK